MYNVDTFMQNLMIVDDRLVITPDVTIRQIADMMKEIKSSEAKYDIIFEVKAFAAYNKMPECIASHIEHMEEGTSCGFGDMEIHKISTHLCVGIRKQAAPEYNELELIAGKTPRTTDVTGKPHIIGEELKLQLCG